MGQADENGFIIRETRTIYKTVKIFGITKVARQSKSDQTESKLKGQGWKLEKFDELGIANSKTIFSKQKVFKSLNRKKLVAPGVAVAILAALLIGFKLFIISVIVIAVGIAGLLAALKFKSKFPEKELFDLSMIIAVCMVVSSVVASLALYSGHIDKFEAKKQTNQLGRVLEDANNLVLKKEYVKAEKIMSIQNVHTKFGRASNYIEFKELLKELKTINTLDSEYVKNEIFNLNEGEFKALKKGKLNKKILNNEDFNKIVIKKMKKVLPTVEKRYWTMISKKKRDEAKRKKDAAAAAKRKARTDKIQAQFSAWDGSHVQLTRYIKALMKDPSSYKHVKTNYWDRGDYLVVQTTYRGKNSYGGVVMETIKVKATLSGNIFDVIE